MKSRIIILSVLPIISLALFVFLTSCISTQQDNDNTENRTEELADDNDDSIVDSIVDLDDSDSDISGSEDESIDISDSEDDNIDLSGSEDEIPIEDLAPDFSVPLLTGETFTLSEHRGSVVVLCFWASWCGPCVVNMPTMQAISEQFEGSAIVVGINIKEDPQWVQEVITRKGISFIIALDENGEIAKDLYQVPGIPYTVIINTDGQISDIFIGGRPDMFEALEEAILAAME